MKSTRYFNGRPYEVELLDEQNIRIGRKGTDYTVDTTIKQVREWQSGQYIQEAMPDLSAEQREFLISGFTPAEFERIFGEED